MPPQRPHFLSEPWSVVATYTDGFDTHRWLVNGRVTTGTVLDDKYRAESGSFTKISQTVSLLAGVL